MNGTMYGLACDTIKWLTLNSSESRVKGVSGPTAPYENNEGVIGLV